MRVCLWVVSSCASLAAVRHCTRDFRVERDISIGRTNLSRGVPLLDERGVPVRDKDTPCASRSF